MTRREDEARSAGSTAGINNDLPAGVIIKCSHCEALASELEKLCKRFHSACLHTGSDPEWAVERTPGADAALADYRGGEV